MNTVSAVDGPVQSRLLRLLRDTGALSRAELADRLEIGLPRELHLHEPGLGHDRLEHALRKRDRRLGREHHLVGMRGYLDLERTRHRRACSIRCAEQQTVAFQHRAGAVAASELHMRIVEVVEVDEVGAVRVP